jgi:hypothetical protein
MKSNGKASTCYSDNPKMGKPHQSQGKGYRDGGRVPEEDAKQSNMSRIPISPPKRVAEIGGGAAPSPTKLADKRTMFKYSKEY